MRIVIASDKFKGSLDASEVAGFLAEGVHSVDADVVIDRVPVADGGEGTLDAALAAGFEPRTVRVTGPTGHPVEAAFAVRADEAVVEMALASGLAVLPDGIPDAAGATSRGTGELIVAALDAGARRIVLGVGGSATTDGGAGLLQGLGARLRDATGDELPGGGAALARLGAIDLSQLDPRIAGTEFVLASDVDNPLLGPRGAAAVFGPQKGLDASLAPDAERALERFATAIDPTGALAATPGAGAAGGTGFGMLAWGATITSGARAIAETIGLPGSIAGAQLVVTGEGRFDGQSAGGKVVSVVRSAADAHGVPLGVLAGSVDAHAAAAMEVPAFSIAAGAASLAELQRDAADLLAAAAASVARLALR
jgi:glycerate kinase